ncbi:MAG TPA: HAD-IA family hydrolase [Acidobacteriaceae bacterium]|nr:HAD-IA family hydrolase [Acidobacteriaceae bacterium]
MQTIAEAIEVQTRGVLFDMDGVLISSIGSVERCWKRWAKLYSVPDAENYQVPHGVRAIDTIRTLKPEFDEAAVAEGLRVIEQLEIDDTADLKVLPGAKALLESLPADRWAIVTSATHRLTLARLAAVGLPVPNGLISGDMVKHGKPDPEPYRRGAELLGLSPADCIVVEDAPSGVGAGLAAGCRVLGMTTTHPAGDLDGATWITPTLEQVQAQLCVESVELHIVTLR